MDLFSYDFMVRALLVGLLVALAAGLLGVPLVLKRFAMIGDGLSHVAFATMALALALNQAPLALALPVVLAASIALLHLSETSRLKGDAALAMVSTSAMAAGVTVMSLSGGLNANIANYMFGSLLAIGRADLWLSVVASSLVIAGYLVFLPYFFAISFDERFAIAAGLPYRRFRMLLAILTAVIVVIGLRLVGALLISGLLIFPASTAMNLARSFRAVIAWAGLIGLCAMGGGLLLAYQWDLPAGATVVLLNLAIYLFSRLFARA